jgi:hypothetical protein
VIITFLLDVEDIITPEADDITRDVADRLADAGLCATFCIVGERARQWRDRGRNDTVAALRRHDVGFHTDLHSVHPVLAERLAPLDWDTGVREAVRHERGGVEAIRALFGVTPSCWGCPGDSWAPQVNEAMREIGVPAMVYQHTRVPHGDIHRFCGILAYPHGGGFDDGAYHLPPIRNENIARVTERVRRQRDAGLQWTEVFLGHPSRMLHEEFWDGPNYSHGANPDLADCVPPRRKKDADVEAALDGLVQSARAVRDIPGTTLRTIREVNELAARGTDEPLSETEIAEVAPAIDKRLSEMSWVILSPDFDTTGIRRLTAERLNTLRRVRLPGENA